MKPILKVMFLAAEAEPFVKVGGLGDVAGSLPPALRKMSVDVRLMLPLHGVIRKQGLALHKVCNFHLPYENRAMPVEAYSFDLNGLPVYFIAGPLIPLDSTVYSLDDQADSLKYAFFSLAALRLAQELNWQIDILHANDWHTALSVYALESRVWRTPSFIETKTLLGVHNLPYLGSGAELAIKRFGLPAALTPDLPEWALDRPLALGLATADRIVAVSPTYAKEILTPQFGSGLDQFLSMKRQMISGILNGLDLDSWDPQTDQHLASRYGADTLDRRVENRISLQKKLGLPENPQAVLLGMVNRMDYQKGVDLLPGALQLLNLLPDDAIAPWQLVVLGTGDPLIEEEIRLLEMQYPDQARVITQFDPGISRMIYGGADLIVIPSRYEACGLTQMIAMRYGCIPLARATGGLSDTIRDEPDDAGNTGFLFDDPSSEALSAGLQRALLVFRDPIAWRRLQRNGMAQDFSWSRSAGQYLDLYRLMASKMNSGADGDVGDRPEQPPI